EVFAALESMDRPHQMDAVGVVQAVTPVLGRTGPDIADLLGAPDRPREELVGERAQPLLAQTERAQTSCGDPDVEAADWLDPSHTSAVVSRGMPSPPSTAAAMQARAAGALATRTTMWRTKRML